MLDSLAWKLARSRTCLADVREHNITLLLSDTGKNVDVLVQFERSRI